MQKKKIVKRHRDVPEVDVIFTILVLAEMRFFFTISADSTALNSTSWRINFAAGFIYILVKKQKKW